jgi:hypothetical protein
VNYTEVEYRASRPLYIRVLFGSFAESIILIEAKPIQVNGTVDPNGVEETMLIHENDQQVTIFHITTGTLTICFIHFVHTNGANSRHFLINVEGNGIFFLAFESIMWMYCIFYFSSGSSTISECIFSQSLSSSFVTSPLVNFNNPSTINIVENCQFSNIVLNEASTIYAPLGKSLDLRNCTFTDVRALVNTQLTQNAYLSGGLYSNTEKLTVSASIFRRVSSDRNGGAVYLGENTKFKFTDVLFETCSAGLGYIYLLIACFKIYLFLLFCDYCL